MNERIYARPLNNGLWQWRQANEVQWRDESISTGDNEALAEVLPTSNTPVHLIIPGEHVLLKKVSVEGIDKKHFAKLLPFELEDDMVESIQNIHIAYGEPNEGVVDVYSVASQTLANYLNQLTEVGCEVVECVPDFALVQSEANQAVVIENERLVIVRIGGETAFATDVELLPLLLAKTNAQIPETLKIIAANDTAHADLEGCIPAQWQEQENFAIEKTSGDFWSQLALPEKVHRLNLRRGPFGRSLPIERWMQFWRIPLIVLGAALIVTLAVTLTEYFQAKAAVKKIRADIQTVYKKAVPNGRAGDEEGRLRALLRNAKPSGGEPTNLMVILSSVANIVDKMDSVKLTSFRYSGDQKQLQASVEVNSLADLNSFTEELNKVGLTASSPRSSAVGDVYQARLSISEN